MKKDYQNLGVKEVKNMISELLVEQRVERFKKTIATVDKPSEFKNRRKEIARLKTILREYELGIRAVPEFNEAIQK